MGTELIEAGIVKQGAIDVTQIIVIGVVVVVLFMIYILIKRNFADMAYNSNIGKFIKMFKSYKTRDILHIDGKDWYVDNLNSYRIKFLEVLEWDKKEGTIKLSDNELSIMYSVFLKMKIHRKGHFGV